MFSPHYKEIEKWLKQKFIDSDILLYGDGGTEWVQADFSIILKVYMDSLSQFSNTDLCYGGKRYKSVNGDIQQYRLPKCRLDLLRILDGFKIKCIKNNKKYVVRNNKIEVNGSLMTLSRFISHNYPRSGKTNKHNGYMYFTFKGELIYDMWQNLVRTK